MSNRSVNYYYCDFSFDTLYPFSTFTPSFSEGQKGDFNFYIERGSCFLLLGGFGQWERPADQMWSFDFPGFLP